MSNFFLIHFIQQVAFAALRMGIRYQFIVAEFIDNDSFSELAVLI